VHAPDGTELLLCLPTDDRPLADRITSHLDGLITGSRLTPTAHLITTQEHRHHAHGAIRLNGGDLTCHALPARYWYPGTLIRALACPASRRTPTSDGTPSTAICVPPFRSAACCRSPGRTSAPTMCTTACTCGPPNQ
jgi:hypothetical protein